MYGVKKGLYLINSSSVIDNTQFLNHQEGCFASEPPSCIALVIEGGSPTVKNSHFENNYTAISIGSWRDPADNEFPATPILENNTFVNNTNNCSDGFSCP